MDLQRVIHSAGAAEAQAGDCLMSRSQIGRAVLIVGVLAVSFMQTPVSFAFTSNRVPHWSDGCVRKHSQKETAKVQRKREKIALANAQGREVPVAFKGHGR